MKADRGAVVLVRALVRLAPSRVGVKWSRRLEDLSNNVRSAKNVRRDTKVQLRVVVDAFAVGGDSISNTPTRAVLFTFISSSSYTRVVVSSFLFSLSFSLYFSLCASVSIALSLASRYYSPSGALFVSIRP